MFIGEMGCWLVVFGFYLTRLIQRHSKDAPLLYQPVPAEDEENYDDTLRPRSSQDAASPAVKPLVPNADDRAPLQGWKTLLLAIPACCDITGTTLMNVGLLFTAASIYQMTRGALVLFVGLFSVLFLKKKLYLFHWVSLVIVVLGVALVGLAGAIWSGKAPVDAPEHALDLKTVVLFTREAVVEAADPAVVQTIIGIFLIAGAQIFTASQFCLEVRVLFPAFESCIDHNRNGFWRITP
jgi:drug/metabolite transporter (DMT)-like permease